MDGVQPGGTPGFDVPGRITKPAETVRRRGRLGSEFSYDSFFFFLRKDRLTVPEIRFLLLLVKDAEFHLSNRKGFYIFLLKVLG